MKIFMVMPFTPHFFNLFEYGYAPVARKLGLDIQTVRDDLQPGPIPAKILKKIAESDIVLVDASQLNANVFFEAGYARGLNKTILWAVEDVEKAPFDTAADLHFIHEGQIEVIRRELPGFLASAVEAAQGENLLTNPSLKVNQNGWVLRSSRRPKLECTLETPGIDRDRTLGSTSSMKIHRLPKGDVPPEHGLSVVEFSQFRSGSGSSVDFVPLDDYDGTHGYLRARCSAFVHTDGPLQHRWRAILYRKPPEYLTHVWGSFASFGGQAEADEWGLVEDVLLIPTDTDARYLRFALESRGATGPTTYWVTRPCVTLEVGSGGR